MRKQKPLNLNQSNVPHVYAKQNYRYKLVDNGHYFTVDTEEYELDQELPRLISDDTYSVVPLFGRPCPLCVPCATSYALILSNKYALFCICCGRYFYDGIDRTDYSTWIPPTPESLIHFVPDVTSAPVEYAMLESGLSYVQEDPKPVETQVRPTRQASTEVKSRITTKLDKDLNYIKINPYLLTGTLLTLTGVLFILLNNKFHWIVL